jgi:hypothetical protein
MIAVTSSETNLFFPWSKNALVHLACFCKVFSAEPLAMKEKKVSRQR